MKKLNVTFIILTVVLLAVNIGQFMWWKGVNAETASQYTAELANVQAQLDSIGSRVEVYTVTTAKMAGDVINEEDITSMWTYSTLLTDQYVTNKSDILGKYYKIAINPGTAITSNMVMEEEISDTTRDHDIIFDTIPVGTHPGDYIDVRMTMPYGDDYVVLSHVRVQEINDETVKVYLDEMQWNVYQGALVDYFLNQDYGCTLYATKYIEPGLQQDAVEFYAVPDNITALLRKNPNILDKSRVTTMSEWRASIEELLVLFRTDEDTVESDSSKLNGGRANLTTAVTTDFDTRVEEEKTLAEQAAEEATNQDAAAEDDTWSDTP